MQTRNQLIKHLEAETRVLRTPEIKSAFEKIDRADFVTEDYKCESYEDYPLPIGFGQTISQPTTVAFMLELLDARSDSEVLDVGSGSGYTTALLAILANKGVVLGIELIPELAKAGKTNIEKYKLKNAKIENRDSKSMRPSGTGQASKDGRNYDRILVNAAATEIPQNLLDILKPGGILVVPVVDSIFKITKGADGRPQFQKFPGFAFVPLK